MGPNSADIAPTTPRTELACWRRMAVSENISRWRALPVQAGIPRLRRECLLDTFQRIIFAIFLRIFIPGARCKPEVLISGVGGCRPKRHLTMLPKLGSKVTTSLRVLISRDRTASAAVSYTPPSDSGNCVGQDSSRPPRYSLYVALYFFLESMPHRVTQRPLTTIRRIEGSRGKQ